MYTVNAKMLINWLMMAGIYAIQHKYNDSQVEKINEIVSKLLAVDWDEDAELFIDEKP